MAEINMQLEDIWMNSWNNFIDGTSDGNDIEDIGGNRAWQQLPWLFGEEVVEERRDVVEERQEEVEVMMPHDEWVRMKVAEEMVRAEVVERAGGFAGKMMFENVNEMALAADGAEINREENGNPNLANMEVLVSKKLDEVSKKLDEKVEKAIEKVDTVIRMVGKLLGKKNPEEQLREADTEIEVTVDDEEKDKEGAGPTLVNTKEKTMNMVEEYAEEVVAKVVEKKTAGIGGKKNLFEKDVEEHVIENDTEMELSEDDEEDAEEMVAMVVEKKTTGMGGKKKLLKRPIEELLIESDTEMESSDDDEEHVKKKNGNPTLVNMMSARIEEDEVNIVAKKVNPENHLEDDLLEVNVKPGKTPRKKKQYSPRRRRTEILGEPVKKKKKVGEIEGEVIPENHLEDYLPEGIVQQRKARKGRRTLNLKKRKIVRDEPVEEEASSEESQHAPQPQVPEERLQEAPIASIALERKKKPVIAPKTVAKPLVLEDIRWHSREWITRKRKKRQTMAPVASIAPKRICRSTKTSMAPQNVDGLAVVPMPPIAPIAPKRTRRSPKTSKNPMAPQNVDELAVVPMPPIAPIAPKRTRRSPKTSKNPMAPQNVDELAVVPMPPIAPIAPKRTRRSPKTSKNPMAPQNVDGLAVVPMPPIAPIAPKRTRRSPKTSKNPMAPQNVDELAVVPMPPIAPIAPKRTRRSPKTSKNPMAPQNVDELAVVPMPPIAPIAPKRTRRSPKTSKNPMAPQNVDGLAVVPMPPIAPIAPKRTRRSPKTSKTSMALQNMGGPAVALMSPMDAQSMGGPAVAPMTLKAPKAPKRRSPYEKVTTIRKARRNRF